MQAGVYRHYRGGLYQVLGVAEHSETGERVVVYVSLTGADLPGPRMRVRPLDMFVEHVSSELQGHPPYFHPRFEYLGDEIPKGYRP